MKGYRFYAEMPQDRKSKSASKANPFFPWTVKALRERAAQGYAPDVLALDLEVSRCGGSWEAASSADGYVSTDLGYLRQRCTRIPEDLARKIAPGLFQRMES